MAYQTLCHRFSMAGTLAAATVAGATISTAVLSGLGSVPPNRALYVGWMIGGFGWLGSAITETYMEAILTARRIGVTKGSRILQGTGLGVYGCILATLISLRAYSEHPETTPRADDPAPIVIPVPAKSIPMLPAPPSSPPTPKLS